VSATARPLRNQDGSPRGSVVVFRDVTEHRRMQAQLLVADRMASVGMLAAGVAHEINNPLAYVTANTDLAVGTLPELLQQALAAPPDDSATRAVLTERFADLTRALEESRQGAERVRAIVRDLSTFARGEDTRNGPVDLRRIVESTLNVASNELRHRARLVRDIDDVDPVDGREGGLGQVVLNLLFHVMHRLSEGAADRNVITVRLKRGADGTTVLELSDNGPAIPPDRLGHLFDPYRVSADGHGSGLGLAVCHATVLALGGSITAANGTDRGCVFRIVLPRSREPLPPPPPSAVKPPMPGKRGRLLIIDDEPMIGASLKRALGREYDVTATTSATDALAALDRGERWDVILCDLMMPTMSGMDLYEALQTRLPDQVERIVFLTGGAFTPRGQRFLAEVPNPRIEKPFDVKNLRDIVRERMG
jgi:C4-dicarboxylate-specific signal transduction histidine kinase/CheY-like chemotaxis protein